MNGVMRATARLCQAVAVSALTSPALGAALSVDPLRLELEPNARATAITVRNDEAVPVGMGERKARVGREPLREHDQRLVA